MSGFVFVELPCWPTAGRKDGEEARRGLEMREEATAITWEGESGI